MAKYAAVSRDRHADKYWRGFPSYAFAARLAVIPLVAAELPKALMSLPVGLVRDGENFTPAAVLSLEPQRNLFVAPDGRWIGGYVPSILRAYPFRLLKTSGEQHVLCVDEESGLLSDGPQGNPFFDETGKLTPPTRKILDFLTQVERNKAETRRACAALAEHQLIVPWTITIKTEAGSKPIEGLFKVDEAALNALPMEDFEALRQAGALVLAHCQILSMQHLQALGRLTEAHAKYAKALAGAGPQPTLDELLPSGNDGDVNIDWSQFDPADKDSDDH